MRNFKFAQFIINSLTQILENDSYTQNDIYTYDSYTQNDSYTHDSYT